MFTTMQKTTALIAPLLFLLLFFLIDVFELDIKEHVSMPLEKKEVHNYSDNNWISLPTTQIKIDDVQTSFHLDITFRISNDDGYPNLFQTDVVNEGIRCEISHGIMSIVYRSGEKLRGLTLSKDIPKNEWHRLKIEYRAGKYLTARLNSDVPVIARMVNESPKLGAIRFGIGFDDTRPFIGEIKNVEFISFKPTYKLLVSLAIALIKPLILLIFFFLSLRYINRNVINLNSPTPTAAEFIKDDTARIDPLLSLRGLACLMVVLGHGMLIFQKPPEALSLIDHGLYNIFFGAPQAGVWIFFTLSGYLMGKGFHKNRYDLTPTGSVKFLRNRAIKILPVYFVCILLLSSFNHPELFQLENIDVIIRHVTFTYDGSQTINPIGPLWTISTEVQFYICVPFIYCVLQQLISRGASPLLLLLSIWTLGLIFRLELFYLRGWEAWSREIYKTVFFNLDIFISGMLVNFLPQSSALRNMRGAFILSLGTCIALGFYTASSFFAVHSLISEDLKYFSLLIYPTFACAASVVIIILSESSSLRADNLLTRIILVPLGKIGLLSYCIYVLHEPIFSSLLKQPGTDLISCLGNIIASLGVVIVASIVIYHYVENPYASKYRR